MSSDVEPPRLYVVPGEVVPEPAPVDLDALPTREVAPVQGPVRVPWPHGRLRTRPHRGVLLVGGVVTDPAEIERIRARARFAGSPWWRRWFGRRPPEWPRLGGWAQEWHPAPRRDDERGT